MSEDAFQAYQRHQWTEALRTLRDCGCVQADGPVMERFQALREMGMASAHWTPKWTLWRLTDLGEQTAAELFGGAERIAA